MPEQLKELREMHGLLQKEIAAILKIKPQQWQRYEQGTNEIPLHYLKKLCTHFHVSADWMLDLPRRLEYPF